MTSKHCKYKKNTVTFFQSVNHHTASEQYQKLKYILFISDLGKSKLFILSSDISLGQGQFGELVFSTSNRHELKSTHGS